MTADDHKHLDLLATFHYVVGGIIGLFSCFPLIHVAFGLLALFGGLGSADDSTDAMASSFFGLMFVGIGGSFVLMGWAVAIVVIKAGSKLKAQKGWTFCVVAAGLASLFVPFGTVLGVFTLVILLKDGVKAAFAANDNPAGGETTHDGVAPSAASE